MIKKIITIAMVVLATLFLVGAASATSLTPDSEVKNIPVGGSVSFTLTLSSSQTESGVLAWTTFDTPITASVDGAATGATGTTPSFAVVKDTPQTHTLTVYADANAVQGHTYYVQVDYLGQNLRLRAMVSPAVEPIPELNTMALTSVGMIGLLGMIMLRRRM